MFFRMLMLKFGITDAKSYWHKLRTVIVISAFVCAVFGASNYGIKGFILGGLLGLAAPAALLWLGILLIGIVIFLAIYVAAWALVICFLWWFLSVMFGG